MISLISFFLMVSLTWKDRKYITLNQFTLFCSKKRTLKQEVTVFFASNFYKGKLSFYFCVMNVFNWWEFLRKREFLCDVQRWVIRNLSGQFRFELVCWLISLIAAMDLLNRITLMIPYDLSWNAIQRKKKWKKRKLWRSGWKKSYQFLLSVLLAVSSS